jgi:hypothetical protein
MRAIKLQAHVKKAHTLSLKLPEDIQEGPVEVIALVPEPVARPAHSLSDFLVRLPHRSRRVRSKEQIDRDLEQERQAPEERIEIKVSP